MQENKKGRFNSNGHYGMKRTEATRKKWKKLKLNLGIHIPKRLEKRWKVALYLMKQGKKQVKH